MRASPFAALALMIFTAFYVQKPLYLGAIALCAIFFSFRFRPEELRKKKFVERFVLLVMIFHLLDIPFTSPNPLYTTLLVCSFLLFAPRFPQNWIFGSLFFVYLGILPFFNIGWALFSGTLLHTMLIFGQIGFSLFITFALLTKQLKDTETFLTIALLLGYLLLEANVLTIENKALGILETVFFYAILLWSHRYFRKS